MDFKELQLDDMKLYYSYTKGCINSESSFANMYIWKHVTNAHIAVVSDMLVVRLGDGAKGYKYLMPFGKKENICSTVNELYLYEKSCGNKLCIIGANKSFVNTISDCSFDFSYHEMRNQQDYIYSINSLASLSGKKLHGKKNHVNKFKSMYSYRFEPLSQNDLELCKQMAQKWLDEKYDGEYVKYKDELNSLIIALDNYKLFNLFGGCIFVDNELIAFTVAEKLTEDTVLVHIEKASADFLGAYNIINYEFATYLKDKFQYVNREEDMGIEGLRKAKMSYRPEFLTDKFKCDFN